jgi:EmrB/QacA subfamily drug resistance transporter
MIFGMISEKKGLQFNYKYGFLIFLIGSALCGLSTNVYMLIISRVIQGVGAAFLVSVGPALITRTFPASERGRGLSVIAMVVSTGLMLGPPLGGFIIALAGWRWIFYVNLPVCIFAIYFTQKFFRDLPIVDKGKKIPIPSSVVLSLCLLSMMFSILLFSKGIIGTGLTSALIGFSIFLLLFFLFLENKPSTRLMGVEIFKNRLFVFSGAAMLLVFISLISVTVLMPFFLEEVKGLRPEQVGLYLMIIPLCAFFVAPLAGFLSDKIEARFVSSFGILLILTGILLVRDLDQSAQIYNIILPLVLIGTGMALFATPNTSTIMGSVKKYQLGTASGMIATIRTLGISFGVALSIAIFTYYRSIYHGENVNLSESFLFGYETVYKIMIYPAILAFIFSLFRGSSNYQSEDIVAQES